MSNAAYRKGLHELGDGLFAYLQPDGSWGWSNAGLVVDGDSSLLVDTLFDLPLTREMLREMERAVPAARAIDTVVNTHANGDHCWGNQLIRGAEIVSSRRSAEEMVELAPGMVATLVRVARLTRRLGRLGKGAGKLAGRVGLRKLAAVAEGADFVLDAFGEFDFRGIELAPPTRTFSGQLSLDVGNTRVDLIEVGPAHTRGDVIAYVPRARTVFTGDILFVGGHPIIWEGPVGNWIEACDRIAAMEVDIVVPGHGPLVDLAAVRELRGYLVWLREQVGARHDAGMSSYEAALDLAGELGSYGDLGEIERLVVNADTIYRELDPARPRRDVVELFGEMARFRRAR